MANEGLITHDEAVTRVDPAALDQLLHPTIDPKAERKLLATGLPASPGAASGEIVFSSDEAESAEGAGRQGHPRARRNLAGRHPRHARRRGHPHHARRHDLARGRGGARHGQALRLGRRLAARRLRGGDDDARPAQSLKKGDIITIDGSTGQVLAGTRADAASRSCPASSRTLMGWADKVRRLKVRANADTPNDARVARKFGAEGIGLCRTEHMFFDEDRILAVREMILADDEKGRRAALAKLLPMQRERFRRAVRDHAGPAGDDPAARSAAARVPAAHARRRSPRSRRRWASTRRSSRDRAAELAEFNPMLGFRGCRLAIAYPEIAEMQARAIFEAAVDGRQAHRRAGGARGHGAADRDQGRSSISSRRASTRWRTRSRRRPARKIDYQIGTMIELPRACLEAGEIAETAEFFSFGTNDLTQTTFGISRDDAASFLGTYTAKGILPDRSVRVASTATASASW